MDVLRSLPQGGGLSIEGDEAITLIKCNLYRNKASYVSARIFYPCATIQRASA